MSKIAGLGKMLVAFFLMSSVSCFAQDTLRFRLPEVERLFVQHNLSLLAQRYNIAIAKAEVIQAKLFNNPNVQYTANVYNPSNRKFFDAGNRGQYVVDVQQLVLLAGKRNKQVRLAETNTAMEESRFFDLLRTLNYSLRSDFYQLYYTQRSLEGYAQQISYLKKLNDQYQQLLAKGVVSLKDAVRIQSLLYGLQSEQTSLQNQANDLNAELQLLIHNNAAQLVPLLDSPADQIDVSTYPLANLLDSAMANRQDLKLAQQYNQYSEQNYVLQKAMAVPDLTLGAEFDKRGSFVDNATFLSVAIDLPFFNRNQGHIKAAKIGVDQAKTQLEEQKEKVVNEVQTAYAKAINANKMIQSYDPNFLPQLQKLLQSVTENFQHKNISLLELTDFYDSYKEHVLQFNALQNERMQAMEALQFAVGKSIY